MSQMSVFAGKVSMTTSVNTGCMGSAVERFCADIAQLASMASSVAHEQSGVSHDLASGWSRPGGGT